MGLFCMLAGAAVIDTYTGGRPTMDLKQFIISFLLVLGLWAGLSPLFDMSTRLWVNRYVTIQRDLGPFSADEMLRFDSQAYRHAHPRFGELVLTRDGVMDLVLGEPGDTVAWTDGCLVRNGELWPGVRPLSFKGTPPEFATEVPPEHYLVLPLAAGYALGNSRQFRQLILPRALIDRHRIRYRYDGPWPDSWTREVTPESSPLPESGVE